MLQALIPPAHWGPLREAVNARHRFLEWMNEWMHEGGGVYVLHFTSGDTLARGVAAASASSRRHAGAQVWLPWWNPLYTHSCVAVDKTLNQNESNYGLLSLECVRIHHYLQEPGGCVRGNNHLMPVIQTQVSACRPVILLLHHICLCKVWGLRRVRKSWCVGVAKDCCTHPSWKQQHMEEVLGHLCVDDGPASTTCQSGARVMWQIVQAWPFPWELWGGVDFPYKGLWTGGTQSISIPILKTWCGAEVGMFGAKSLLLFSH